MEYINVLENPEPLFELCKQEGWTDADLVDDFDELSFFEGDPDMVKVNGRKGYFAKIDDTVFYWFDNDVWIDEVVGEAVVRTSAVEILLRGFFESFQTGVTIGGESYAHGTSPEGVFTHNSWDFWRGVRNGIAFRGGAGYTYWITDWSEWLENRLAS